MDDRTIQEMLGKDLDRIIELQARNSHDSIGPLTQAEALIGAITFTKLLLEDMGNGYTVVSINENNEIHKRYRF